MKLSRLKELRPDVWEEAKRQTIKQEGEEKWDYYVIRKVNISMAFTWDDSDQKYMIWNRIGYDEDFTLYDEWLASQTKQPESKKEIEYWRYQFAGMAMQATDLEQYANNFGNKWAEKVAIDSVQMADALIKELQKEKP